MSEGPVVGLKRVSGAQLYGGITRVFPGFSAGNDGQTRSYTRIHGREQNRHLAGSAVRKDLVCESGC
jgi:hypothetical protein